MLRDKEERARLIRQSSRQAITLAMEGRWKEAVEANKGILENFPDDVDTLNRLGRAYIELGEYAEARAAYQRAREIDPYNSIADKNMRRLANLEGETGAKEESGRLVEPRYFIEETGKAGVVRLFNLAPKDILSRVVAGDRVSLEVDGGNLMVKTEEGQILGWVEPKHGQRLAKLMSGGNEYLATVTSSSENGITVMIREIYQHPSQSNQLSFPSKGLEAGHPFVSDKLIHRHLEYEESGLEESEYGLAGDEEIEPGSEEVADETEEDEEE
jgi:tetratricopeptide (TPR) repeat protein